MIPARTAAQVASEHHENLLRWALGLCHGDREEAMELVQQLYVALLEGRIDLSNAKDEKAYLYGAARRLCASRRRRHAVWAKVRDVFGRGQAAQSPSDLQVVDALAVRRLGELLGQLPERQRQVAELVFSHDMTVEAAAEVMGVSVGSARTHYHRAKERLQSLVEES